MNILILHHGGYLQYSQPVSGSALRAEQLGLALSQAGHGVQWLGKGAAAPNGYSDRSELFDLLEQFKYDVVLLIQIEDAPLVENLNVPIVVDLYAQRLLEANFAGTLEQDTLHVLRAIRAGDLFLCSNRRQYWSWISVLSLSWHLLRARTNHRAPPYEQLSQSFKPSYGTHSHRRRRLVAMAESLGRDSKGSCRDGQTGHRRTTLVWSTA